MTWYFDPDGMTIDVYDHEGTQVRTDLEFEGRWSGDFPDLIYTVMREEMEGSGAPTAYNQQLLADAATDNIEQGTPPTPA